MTIEEEDFKLEFNEWNSKFDLYLMQVINAKDPEKRREEFKQHGYGMSIESCFRTIVTYRINRDKDVITLKEYVQSYKKEVDSLKHLAGLIETEKELMKKEKEQNG